MISKHKTFLAWGAGILVPVMLAARLYKVMGARSFQFFSHITSGIDTQEKMVALTLDDGPG